MSFKEGRLDSRDGEHFPNQTGNSQFTKPIKAGGKNPKKQQNDSEREKKESAYREYPILFRKRPQLWKTFKD